LSEQIQPGTRAPAPGNLKVVQQFINSADLEEGSDRIDSTTGLSSWLYDHKVTARRLRLAPADVQRARRFREMLRSLALANNGIPLSESATRSINQELSRLPLMARVKPGDTMQIESGAAGLDQALGRLLAIVLTEAISGRWSRLKACPRDICHWAFYDHSRSRTGTWCTMAVCGSRVKAQAYYRRQAKKGDD
jgi:predicted RNA-binding Zn ribbon-like protein